MPLNVGNITSHEPGVYPLFSSGLIDISQKVQTPASILNFGKPVSVPSALKANLIPFSLSLSFASMSTHFFLTGEVSSIKPINLPRSSPPSVNASPVMYMESLGANNVEEFGDVVFADNALNDNSYHWFAINEADSIAINHQYSVPSKLAASTSVPIDSALGIGGF